MNDDPIGRMAERFNRIACSACGTTVDVSAVAAFSTFECPSCGARQTVPVQLANFLLIGRLGDDGVAALYEAYDRALGRPVAISIPHAAPGGGGSNLLDALLREARSAAQVNHPNVVRIYQVGQHNGQPFIVMELLKGGRLSDVIAGGAPMDEAQALQVALDVSAGLQAAAALRLVHGDVNPAAILFDKQGHAKISDFGLAQYGERIPVDGGDIWGTPAYMPPERLRRQAEDLRSDVYGLGATLYHALTGHPPFEGSDPAAVARARLEDLPVPMSEYRKGLTSQTILLVARMLEPDPFRRHPNYGSLIADLKSALLAAKNRPAAAPEAGTASAAASRSRRPWLVPAVAVGLAAVGGLVFALSGPGRKEVSASPKTTVKPAPARAPASAPVAAAAALARPPPILLDCGQTNVSFPDHLGRIWLKDLPYSPETGAGYMPEGEHNMRNNTRDPFLMDSDPWLYRTYQWVKSPAWLRYRFDIKTPGDYLVRLHFMETRPPVVTAGSRLFHIWISGRRVVENFDIFVEAGDRLKPVIKEFTVKIDPQKPLLIGLEPVRENTTLSAIEVIPAGGS